MLTCGCVGDIVGGGMVQVSGAVGHEKFAVEDIEGHVAEWQQLKEQHGEEDDCHAPEGRARSLRDVVECQPCTSRCLPQQRQCSNCKSE